MSFLNQLKSQAAALQSHQEAQRGDLDRYTAETEAACRIALTYLQDLARQLNVLTPAGPAFTLDGKTPWPAMKLTSFVVDARKRTLRGKEVFDNIAIGWQILPQVGAPVGGVVTVNFPPDMERVEKRLSLGSVKHERREQRHPEKNTLQAIRYEYLTETRGGLAILPDHDKGVLAFRLLNTRGFEVANTEWPAARIQTNLLDELAKLVVAQPSLFV